MRPAEFVRIAKRYRPHGIRVKWRRKGLRPAEANKPAKLIYSPKPDTPMGLFYFLHEAAHIHLDHWANVMPRWQQEYEAEQWAMATLQRHGIPVSREMWKDARQNVRQYLGPKAKPPRHVLRWLGKR